MSSTATALATPEMLARYEVVIGLEVHVQLATATKIFCGCPTSFFSLQAPIFVSSPSPRPIDRSEHALTSNPSAGCGGGQQPRPRSPGVGSSALRRETAQFADTTL